MKILNLVQGSDEWVAARALYRTASESSMMMNEGKTSRADLVRMSATGAEQEFSRWVLEVLFARGHEIEAEARPLAEEMIGEELFPVTGVDEAEYLLASFDGLTMGEDIAWECKSWNEAKAANVRDEIVPAADFWQVYQQLLVSGAEKLLYMVTDATPDKTVTMWVYPDQKVFDALLAHWTQFDADVAAYVPTEVVPEPVGRSPDALPALRLEVTGAVTASNLEAFKDHALAVFAGINTELSTDAQFADAEKTVKWCKSVEDQLEAAKQQALEQTASIDELFRAIDAIKDESRTKRLELDRLVKSRKESLRNEIINDARAELAACVLEHAESFSVARVTMPAVPADFAGVMKGKRTFKSLRDAVDGELARAKVEAGSIAARIHTNLKAYEEFREGYGSLFSDLHNLVLLENTEGFIGICKSRVADFQADQQRKADEAAKPAPGPTPAQQVEAAVERAQVASKPKKRALGYSVAPLANTTARVADPTIPPCPSYGEMMGVLAAHYGVTPVQAANWISEHFQKEALQ